MSKFAISKLVHCDSVWRLLLTLWVGSSWALSFIVLPGLSSTGLAPLLVNDVGAVLVPKVLAMTLFCTLTQAGMLVCLRGLAQLFRESLGLLLLAVILVAAATLLLLQLWPQLLYWRLLGCLLVGLLGLLLVLQPQPAWRDAG